MRGTNKFRIDDKELLEMRSKGIQYKDIAKHFGVSYNSIRKHLNQMNLMGVQELNECPQSDDIEELSD